MGVYLITVRGPIGVGKSTISRAICAAIDSDSSVIEIDAFKRMIDPSHSTEWRRNIATDTALFLTNKLLQKPRTVIIELHSKYPQDLESLARLAKRHKVPIINVLLTAPLSVCKERASKRIVSDINYDIDEEMIERYYGNLEPLQNDLLFDTYKMHTDGIVKNVLENIPKIV
jgi:predicted kinase